MITSAQLDATTQRWPARAGGLRQLYVGVLTLAEAQQCVTDFHRLTVVKDQEVYFFTADHQYGYTVLPRAFVPVSYSFPMFNMNRFRGPSTLNTTAELIDAHYSDHRLLETVDGVVAYINERYP